MDFKKLLIIGIFSIGLLISIYYISKVEEHTTTTTTTTSPHKDIVVVENDVIEETKTQTETKVEIVEPLLVKKEILKEEIKANKVEKIENIASHEQAIKYIENHALKNISNPTTTQATTQTDTPRFSVYSDVSFDDVKNLKNQFTPPVAPAIISGVFPSGEQFTVVVDGNIKATAKEIAVSNNQIDGVITEMATISTNGENSNQESVFMTPPSLPQ